MANDFTHIGSPDDVVVAVIKTNLSPNLGALAQVLSDQVEKCLDKEFPPCQGTVLAIISSVGLVLTSS